MATAAQLFDALSKGDFGLSEDLLRQGADPNEVLPVEGVAPMHIAAGLSDSATHLLLDYKGNPNVRSVEGTTPMHVACMWGKKDILIDLLQHGGDPFIKDEDGETAFGSARKFSDCVETIKSHISEELDSSSSTMKDLLSRNTYCMDVTSPDHPYIDIKGRRNDTLTSEDSFLTCTSHCDTCTCGKLQKSPCLDHNRNAVGSNCSQTNFGQEDMTKERESVMNNENYVYEVFKDQMTSPRCSPRPFYPVNLSDLMTSDESFCPENNDILRQFNAMNIKSPNQRKVFSPPVTLPSSLPANLSDLLTSDESFCPPSKPSFAKSLNSLALKSPSKKELVRQWHQQNFPLASDTCSSTLEQSGNSEDTELYDPYDDLNKTLPYSIDTISLGSTAESTIHYWEDPDTGNKLIEKHILSSFCGSSGRPSINNSICSLSTVDSQKTELYDWKCYSHTSDDINNVLSNKEVRQKLQSLGDNPGPVIPSTRQTYLSRLKHLETNVKCGQLGILKKLPDYPTVLCNSFEGNFDVMGLREMEDDLIKVFNDKSLSSTWREGALKSSFNYLLLDPRITQDLPNRADNLGELETFKIFVGAIFYIGKGKRSRPYCHLFEAQSHMNNNQGKAGSKVQHILDIWNDGQGVVSLHCFQSVIPVEAYTREACMVDAIGLPRLTNIKRGDVYGPATSWSKKNRQRFGVFLLKKALQIFLGEGERQISPGDIKK
ncbi:uncharacterized protein LOC133181485 [Saccostrea echinata]|uniref:uncharacterized protein LOC133181485 n=1 Tax=Saccostrea echinata TaxID=191078 RepID=UPI002A832371|nr:uncharacterized protein LOC133181485 [Saccostrea echinata]